MTDDLIEYKGKKYTPLELAVLLAKLLPDEHRKIVESTTETIRQDERQLKQLDDAIAQAEKMNKTEEVARFKEQRRKTERWMARNEAFLRLVISQRDNVQPPPEKAGNSSTEMS